MKQYISLSILLELTRKEKVTAKYLANKFEISVRSVYRYLNELESAGIPTYTQVGKNGGIGIEKTFVLDRLTLSNEEKFLIKQALSLVDDDKYYTQCQNLIKKLNL